MSASGRLESRSDPGPQFLRGAELREGPCSHTRRCAMRIRTSSAISALAVAGCVLVIAAPAVASGSTDTMSGRERFNGVILTSGMSGQRVVVSTLIRAHGVFD